MTREPWREAAACLDEPTETFYPGSKDYAGIAEARAICQACPVRNPCLAFALATGDRDGIFGGLTPGGRARLRRRLAGAAT